MQILKEEVLGIRGGWVVKGRVIVYHQGQNRQKRVELFLEKGDNLQHHDVGWTIEELAELHNVLVKWKQKVGE